MCVCVWRVFCVVVCVSVCVCVCVCVAWCMCVCVCCVVVCPGQFQRSPTLLLPQIMQHLQRMRVHLHEGTFPASTVSLKEDGGNSLLALESKVEVITEPVPPNTPPRKKKKRRKKFKRRETNRVQPSFNVGCVCAYGRTVSM